MKLTPNFSLDEFLASETALARGIKNTPSKSELENIGFVAVQMEIVRCLLNNRGIQVTSGFRNAKLNKAVGGSPSSDHRRGLACDFRVYGIASDLEIARILETSNLRFDQIIRYGNGRLHIGFGEGMRRQKLVKTKTGYKNVRSF